MHRLIWFSTFLHAYDQVWIMLVLCSITPSQNIYARNLNVSKRERYCIFPDVSYTVALELANITSLDKHQEILTQNLFQSMMHKPNFKLNNIMPKINDDIRYNLRKQRPLIIPRAKTKRFSNSFLIASGHVYNKLNT